MNDFVPMVDVAAQQREILDEVRPAIDEILATGAFIGGAHVDAFEEAYARFSGAGHCVGVANGTDALEIALRAVGVEHGHEVVLPANTFIATAEAVARIGAVEPDQRSAIAMPKRRQAFEKLARQRHDVSAQPGRPDAVADGEAGL